MSNINILVIESLTESDIGGALKQAAVWGAGTALAAHAAHKAAQPVKPKLLKPMTPREKDLHKLKKQAHRKVLKASALAGTIPGFVGHMV